jgi:hypothetical protein
MHAFITILVSIRMNIAARSALTVTRQTMPNLAFARVERARLLRVLPDTISPTKVTVNSIAQRPAPMAWRPERSIAIPLTHIQSLEIAPMVIA